MRRTKVAKREGVAALHLGQPVLTSHRASVKHAIAVALLPWQI
ncbi:hypothetical protein [Phaeobacter porticola]|nr:hypothetical protein [Phaeobacter porticola]